jgi:thioredoxin reductase (NADPH)
MYSGRFQLKTLVIADLLGGTITLTDVVENYPGFVRLSGYDLAKKLEEHARDYPTVEFEEAKANKVTKCDEHPPTCWVIQTSEKQFHSKTIIFATGTEWRKLNVPGEKEYSNRGVHWCALCDGSFYKEKTVGIVGGSDSAAKDALLLTQWAKKVYIIYRGEKIRPEPINLKRVEQNQKIEVINNANVLEIKGENNKVNKVVLDRAVNGGREFPLDAVFIAIGHNLLSQLAKDLGVAVNRKEEIIIDRLARTNVPGLFAAGDVVDTEFKQAITGAAEGVLASYSAYQHVKNEAVLTSSDSH